MGDWPDGMVSAEIRWILVGRAFKRNPALDRELHRLLKEAEPASGLGRALAVALSPSEKAAAEPRAEGRYRVGVSKT
ncbi:MAG TPA: hypothetical protein VHJ58_22655, partial [Vicinamibacterales bacterium]|nr:hypothetical protein [Vicinamibacterales bacterium]